MPGLLSYWRLVALRSWQRTWAAVIERDLWAICRDLIFLLLAALAVLELKGILTKLNAPVDVRSSEWETGLWVVASVAAVVAVFVVYFFLQLFFVTPYTLWKEQRIAASDAIEEVKKADAVEEDLTLRRQALEIQRAHTDAIRDQTEQQRQQNDPLRRAIRDSQHQALEKLRKPVPDWPIRDAFYALDPNLLEDERWLALGNALRDLLATGQIQAWGRKRHQLTSTLGALQAIERGWWAGANWTYDFLGENKDGIDAYEILALGNIRTEYCQIQFSRYELEAVWRSNKLGA